MKTRAPEAFEAKKPLEIVELDLEGPKAGEVLVEIMATGICHTGAHKIEIDPMITQVLSLEEINTGFDLMHAGESVRSVVAF